MIYMIFVRKGFEKKPVKKYTMCTHENTSDSSEATENLRDQRDKSLSRKIKQVLDHYDSVGL